MKERKKEKKRRNILNENTFLKCMKVYCEAKMKLGDPHHQHLQSKEISTIIKDYVQENYEVEKIKKEKMENYLKLLVSTKY